MNENIETGEGLLFLQLDLLDWQERNGGLEHFTVERCNNKLIEEWHEWATTPNIRDAEETADIIIAAMNYMIVAHGNLVPLYDKLQVVLARNDQQERDKERGIG